MLGEDLWQHVRQGASVLQHVRDARGVAQVVLQHAEDAVLIADQVDARDVDAHVVRRLDAPGLAVQVGGAGDQGAGDHVIVQHLALAVDVGEDELKGAQPLDDAGFDALPFGRRDDARHQIHRQRALALAQGEGDAVSVQVGVALAGPLGKSLGAELLQGVEQGTVSGARPAAFEHLVEWGRNCCHRHHTSRCSRLEPGRAGFVHHTRRPVFQQGCLDQYRDVSVRDDWPDSMFHRDCALSSSRGRSRPWLWRSHAGGNRRGQDGDHFG